MSAHRPQSAAHHARIVPGYHYVLLGILAVNLVLRVVWAFRSPTFANVWGIVMAVAFILMGWYLRVFPLAVQDRVIRMEERQRLGRLLPPEVRPRLGEFTRREGDPNVGGTTRRKIVTAYRQDALRCARWLAENGPTKAALVARLTGVERARKIMADNHYGWFERVTTGVYALASDGKSE